MTSPLTAAQIDHFAREGYLFPLDALTRAEAADCRRRLEAYETETGQEAQKRLKIKAHLAFPWMTALGRHPAILAAVTSIIGPDVLLFGSSLFAKNARDVRFVSWHQDSAYFGLTPHEEVTAWVAFTPSNPGNGCLRVLPQSHLGPDLKHEETYDPKNLLARGQTIHGIAEASAADIRLEAGQFSLHHERTAHGSLANHSNDRRIGLAFFYIPTHVQSTIGRRGAMLVHGHDRYRYWDRDPEPQVDADPVCMAYLDQMWSQYQDRRVRQAAEAGLI
jgi:non-haem Fe2+, alpha-ketoglutarate-dependent halogenase